MSFLLDTNVVSEWTKSRPDTGLMRWLAEADEDRLFLSVITIAELRSGIERLGQSARRKRLHDWLQHELRSRFQSRVVPIDEWVAEEFGKIFAREEVSGRRIEVMDAFIAATAVVHDLRLVTRNVKHFHFLPDVMNPWSS